MHIAHSVRSRRPPPSAAMLAVTLLLAACAALDAPPTPRELAATELAHASVPAAWQAGAPGAVQDRWLASFGDDRLLPLADEALRHNADLRLAAARVDAAAAVVRGAGGGLYPEVGVVGRTSGKATGASGQLSGALISASWEIDLWGRVRYGQQAAIDQYASTEADLRYARQSIVAGLARAWFMAAEARQQQALAAEMVTSAERLKALAEDRLRVGAGTEADVAVARGNLQTYLDNAAQVDYAVAQSRRALEVLLGRYPAAEIAVPTLLVVLPPPAPAGLPSELLERRPDVIAAQRRVSASFAKVGEAGAARLPRLSLTAALSWISSSIFVLQDRDDPSAGLGATVFYPLFNGGQLGAQVELRSAEQKQAAAAFAVTALRAFNEVETALANEAVLATREAILRQGLADSRRALELEEQRYKVGSRDLRSVSQQQLVASAASMTLLRVQTEQRLQRVQLHLALGGDAGVAMP
jgi:outer membrane protein, multidrug efflux system